MLISALVFGLLGSFHCVGMCGPIAFMLPVSRDNPLRKFLQVFLYHFGRLFAYSLIGLAFGIVGKSLYLFGMQQQLSIMAGVFMISAVVIPSQKFQKFNLTKPLFKYIGKLKSSLGTALKKKTWDVFFSIGFLNGLLPCGLVYMAVLGALASGDIIQGSVYMLLFGLGTIPLMTTAVYSSSLITGKWKSKVRKVIPAFVVVIGVLFILRGMGLGIPFISPTAASPTVSAAASCH